MWIYFLLAGVMFLGIMGLVLLFLPIRVQIDTRENNYGLVWFPLLGIRWMAGVDGGHAEIKICGIRHRITGNDFQQRSLPRSQKKTARFRLGPKQVLTMIRTFRIKKWRVYIDTGNMALNGQLFPLCYLLGLRTGKKIHINFLGINEVAITVESNLYRMVKALLPA